MVGIHHFTSKAFHAVRGCLGVGLVRARCLFAVWGQLSHWLLRAVSLGNWIVGVSLLLQVLFRPYDRDDMNRLDAGVLGVTYVRLSTPCIVLEAHTRSCVSFSGLSIALGVLLRL